MSSLLASLRIILVEPAGSLNVGSVARVMKNMGLRQLILVNPHCDPVGPEARLMAVHAADILEAAHQVPTLSAALEGCQRAIATTGLDRTTLNVPLESPRQALPWLLDQGNSANPITAALIFGREDRGLTKAELNYAQRFVRIPTSSDYLSLNLAQAVAICCYELTVWAEQQESQLAELQESNPQRGQASWSQRTTDLAPLDALEGYYQQLETVLLKIGYLYPHTAASRMEKFRQLFGRAQLSQLEVAMLRGVLSQMDWALQKAASLFKLDSVDRQ